VRVEDAFNESAPLPQSIVDTLAWLDARDAPRAFTRPYLLDLYTKAPRAFWRHDVDLDLAAAVRMARFAQVAGVSATFYLMTTSDTYNLLGAEGRAAIAAIATADHSLGLHVDHRAGAVPEATAERAFAVVEASFPGLFTRRISFHMPTGDLLWRDFDGFESAYAAKWEGRYVSDSRREWDAEKEARVTNDMQVCLHPEWWFG